MTKNLKKISYQVKGQSSLKHCWRIHLQFPADTYQQRSKLNFFSAVAMCRGKRFLRIFFSAWVEFVAFYFKIKSSCSLHYICPLHFNLFENNLWLPTFFLKKNVLRWLFLIKLGNPLPRRKCRKSISRLTRSWMWWWRVTPCLLY